MNKIIVEVSVGELLDKISILEIKKEKIKDPEKLKFISNEHSILKDQFEKNVKSDDKLNKLFQDLKEINAKLWVIEDDKRDCEKNKDFGDKFISFKNEIDFKNLTLAPRKSRHRLDGQSIIFSINPPNY